MDVVKADDGVRAEESLEHCDEVQEKLAEQGLEQTKSNRVQWREDSASHPRNWKLSEKSFTIFLIAALDFIATLLSSSGIAAALAAHTEFHVSSEVSLVAFNVMYQLGQGFGGIVFPPYSECFGRKQSYLASSITICVSCIIVGVPNSIVAVFIGRLLQGLAASVPAVVAVGSMEDIFDSRARISVVFTWVTSTTAAITVGPIYGSYVSNYIGWQWQFYIGAIVAGLLSILFCIHRESRPSLVLKTLSNKVQKETQSDDIHPKAVDEIPSLGTFLQSSVFRPVQLYFTEPIVFVTCTLNSLGWGLVYLFTVALDVVYEPYGFSETSSSLAFIPILVGALATIPLRFYDLRLLDRYEANRQPVEPENKILGFALAAPALALGMWLFAWTVPPAVQNVPWIVSMIGLVLVGFASNELEYTLGGYLADSYGVYASSAFASYGFLRSMLAAGFPLFGNQMYSGLGSNVASSIIAGFATLWVVSPYIFIK